MTSLAGRLARLSEELAAAVPRAVATLKCPSLVAVALVHYEMTADHTTPVEITACSLERREAILNRWPLSEAMPALWNPLEHDFGVSEEAYRAVLAPIGTKCVT